MDMTGNERTALMLNNMNKSFGGNKPKMRETQIKQEKGYLGPYQRLLQPGDTQKMILESNDVGPFQMSPEEREKQRHDIYVKGRVVKRKLPKK